MKKLNVNEMAAVNGGSCTVIGIAGTLASILGFYPLAFVLYSVWGACYMYNPNGGGSGSGGGCEPNCVHAQ